MTHCETGLCATGIYSAVRDILGVIWGLSVKIKE